MTNRTYLILWLLVLTFGGAMYSICVNTDEYVSISIPKPIPIVRKVVVQKKLVVKPKSTQKKKIVINKNKQTRKESFIQKMKDKVEKINTKGVPKNLIVAQACLETGYGKHAQYNNLFCMTGTGPAGHYKHKDTDWVNGKKVVRVKKFKAYNNYDEAIKDLVSWYREREWFQNLVIEGRATTNTVLCYLGQSDYATDPSYQSKLKSIIKKNNL